MGQKIQDAVEEELRKMETNEDNDEVTTTEEITTNDDSDIYTPSDEEKVEYDEMIDSY